MVHVGGNLFQSLSARRAWIEIRCFGCSGWLLAVALRKESVDRNEGVVATKDYSPWSLSARRAWIEIVALKAPEKPCQVALRKESVDRNYIIKLTVCRPAASLSARRAWIEIIPKPGNVREVERRSPQGERG